jgi:hypothetical protein
MRQDVAIQSNGDILEGLLNVIVSLAVFTASLGMGGHLALEAGHKLLRFAQGGIHAIQDFCFYYVLVEPANERCVNADGIEGVSHVVDKLLEISVHAGPFHCLCQISFS